jgi:ectoine hydroxylase-related dioxygenase (phytanoyl-CoA dioxygenase family)
MTTATRAVSDLAAASAFFLEHGYYHAKGVLGADELAVLGRDFDRIVGQITATGDANARWGHATTSKIDGGRPTVVVHTHQVQKYSPAWGRLMYHERILDLVEAFIGPDIVLHHSKLFLKPAGFGAPFPPHQDWPYFPCVQDSMIAGIAYLSDATDEMGCVRVWPGSHRLGRIPQSDGSGAEFDRRFPIETGIPCEVKAGDMIFFHYCTVHASLPNRDTSRDRKSVLFQYRSGKDRLEDGDAHTNAELTLRGWNHTMTRDRAAI